jgi:hypothetical protein
MAKRPSKEYVTFTKGVDRLLAVPRAELQRRIDAHKEKAAQNPNRRGPKRKAVTPSDDDVSSHDATEAS